METATVTDEDKQAFIDMQKEIRGEEFIVPEIQPAPQAAQSMFSVYREALGAPKLEVLSTGQHVMVAQPKVKTVKYLLSKADDFGRMAADKGNPTAVLDEFQKIMVQCFEFPNEDKPENVGEWFEDLPAIDGMALADSFSQVFDMRFLMQRASELQPKK